MFITTETKLHDAVQQLHSGFLTTENHIREGYLGQNGQPVRGWDVCIIYCRHELWPKGKISPNTVSQNLDFNSVIVYLHVTPSQAVTPQVACKGKGRQQLVQS